MMARHYPPTPAAAPSGGLFVRQYGQRGPLMVLLHGLGASGRSWRLVAEHLAPRARLRCPDLLGFGRSPWPTVAYTVEDHLAALRTTVDRLNPDREPIILAGHSTGAMLALTWAAREPQRFAGVLLVALPAYRSPAEAIARISALSPLAWASVARPHWGELICGVMCAWRPFWRRLMPLLARDVPADIARDYVLHNWMSYSSTLQNVLVQHRATSVADTLAASRVPVRLLHGAHDTIAPLDAVTELATAHGWPVDVVARGDHHVPVRRPAICAAHLWALASSSRMLTDSSRRV